QTDSFAFGTCRASCWAPKHSKPAMTPSAWRERYCVRSAAPVSTTLFRILALPSSKQKGAPSSSGALAPSLSGFLAPARYPAGRGVFQSSAFCSSARRPCSLRARDTYPASKMSSQGVLRLSPLLTGHSTWQHLQSLEDKERRPSREASS